VSVPGTGSAPDATVNVTLARGEVLQHWLSTANDGADLPPALRTERTASFRFGPGETYDFVWTPTSPGDAVLDVHWPFPTDLGELRLQQIFRVR
jgi:hypothetical protein